MQLKNGFLMSMFCFLCCFFKFVTGRLDITIVHDAMNNTQHNDH